jgi:hypothetical protein
LGRFDKTTKLWNWTKAQELAMGHETFTSKFPKELSAEWNH